MYPSSRHDRPHARLYDHDLKHPAWKNLNPHAFKLITILIASYRPNKPNSFPVGRKTVSQLIGVSERTASVIVNHLIWGGHLREERAGRNRGSVRTRERIVSLTRFDTETSPGQPNRPIQRWKEMQTELKLRRERVHISGSEEDHPF